MGESLFFHKAIGKDQMGHFMDPIPSGIVLLLSTQNIDTCIGNIICNISDESKISENTQLLYEYVQKDILLSIILPFHRHKKFTGNIRGTKTTKL